MTIVVTLLAAAGVAALCLDRPRPNRPISRRALERFNAQHPKR